MGRNDFCPCYLARMVEPAGKIVLISAVGTEAGQTLEAARQLADHM